MKEIIIEGKKFQSEEILLHISCENLPNMDYLSKTDAQAVLFNIQANNIRKEMGRTEVVKDDLNPTFDKSLTINYIFERH